jgi:transposase
MKVVEPYGRVRFAVQGEGLSNREAARRFGIDPRTVAKMLLFSGSTWLSPHATAEEYGPRALPAPDHGRPEFTDAAYR